MNDCTSAQWLCRPAGTYLPTDFSRGGGESRTAGNMEYWFRGGGAGREGEGEGECVPDTTFTNCHLLMRGSSVMVAGGPSPPLEYAHTKMA